MYVALCLTAKAIQRQEIKKERESKSAKPQQSIVPDIAKRGIVALAVLVAAASSARAAEPGDRPTETPVAATAATGDQVRNAATTDDCPTAATENTPAADHYATTAKATTGSSQQPEQTASRRVCRTASHATARTSRGMSARHPQLVSPSRRTAAARIMLVSQAGR